MRIVLILFSIIFHSFIGPINAQTDSLIISSLDIPRIPITTNDCSDKGLPQFKLESHWFIEEFESIELSKSPILTFQRVENNQIKATILFQNIVRFSTITIEDYCLNKSICDYYENLILIAHDAEIKNSHPVKINYGTIITLHHFPWKEYLKKMINNKSFKISNSKHSIKVKKNKHQDTLTFHLYALKKHLASYVFKKGKLISKHTPQ